MSTNSLSKRYRSVRNRSVELCNGLQEEDFVIQASYFASPTKWHLAHTTWFFETFILKEHGINYSEYHKDFAFLFNSYYQSLGERAARDQRGLMSRPTVKEVFEYRNYVDKYLIELIDQVPNEAFEELLILGLQHEEQHQELMLTDLKYLFSFSPLHPTLVQAQLNKFKKTQAKSWVEFAEGMCVVGAEGNIFSFDNETPKHKVYHPSFSISNMLVTNKEYIEFIEDGGYTDFKYWLDEGWSWVQENNISHPLYWQLIDNEWHHYNCRSLEKINIEDAVAHVSFYEANAYANWKGFRLPTEFEWEIAASKFDWGERWEWTSSAYLPYPGYRIKEGAVGEYNGKFMVNQMVLRGASEFTAKGHSRKSYRNFFHPHFQWQLTGIRLAK